MSGIRDAYEKWTDDDRYAKKSNKNKLIKFIKDEKLERSEIDGVIVEPLKFKLFDNGLDEDDYDETYEGLLDFSFGYQNYGWPGYVFLASLLVCIGLLIAFLIIVVGDKSIGSVGDVIITVAFGLSAAAVVITGGMNAITAYKNWSNYFKNSRMTNLYMDNLKKYNKSTDPVAKEIAKEIATFMDLIMLQRKDKYAIHYFGKLRRELENEKNKSV